MVIWRNENNDKNPTDDAKEIYDRKMQEPIPPPDPKIFTQSISDVVREKDEDKSLPFGFLPPDSTAHILANQRFLLPENRNYLIRPRDMKALEEQRANDSALADHGWWKSMTGFNMSYLDNMINSFGYLFSGPKLGNLVHGQNTTSYSTMTGQRGMPEKRACDWQMHQFQMCLAVHTQNPNPQWMFPHPYIPPLFGLDWILCKQTYFCPECADFRLLAEQVCDPTERIMYINREVWDYVAQGKIDRMTKRVENARQFYVEQIKEYKEQFMLKVTGKGPEVPENLPESAKRSGPLVHPNMSEFEKQKLSEVKKRATEEEFAEFTRKDV